MENKELMYQLFIGKVVDVLGFEKTLQLLKEAKNDLKNNKYGKK